MRKISVILPVHNGEKYIKNAIESVLNQSFNDFELIIVNDGSTDNTLEIINSFDDFRASRNNALKIASGEYIMFLDADDWFSSDALKIA